MKRKEPITKVIDGVEYIPSGSIDAALRVGDIAWEGVGKDESRVIVTAIGIVDDNLIAVYRSHPEGPNRYTGSWVDAGFAGDLTPESHADSGRRWREHPETLGWWRRWERYEG